MTGRRASRTALAVALLVAGCSAGSGGESAGSSASTTTALSPTEPAVTTAPTTTFAPAPEPPPLVWTSCDEDVECATLPVPLDWADPSGPTIDLALARRPAEDPDGRIGAVLFNPGGPGASGVTQVRVGPSVDEEVAARFDLVSWDPRGVGESASLACEDLPQPWFGDDSAPDDEVERAAIEDRARTLAEDCAARDAVLVPFLGTNQTIRDLDQIRTALGEEQLNFVGSSYGTFIGQLYAEAFPARVRAMVLDGAVDPALDLGGLATGQALGFEALLTAVLASCTRVCPDEPNAAYDALAQRLEAESLPSDDGEPFTAGDLTLATVMTAYDPAVRSTFLRGLAEAEAGDATLLDRLGASYAGLSSYAPYIGVLCADWPSPDGPDGFAALAGELDEQAPRLGDAFGYELLPCAYWPDTQWRDPAPVHARGAPPIMVVAVLGDRVTPLEQAQRVSDALQSAVLVTSDGEGHGALGRSRCLDGLVTRYLVDLVVPADGTRC